MLEILIAILPFALGIFHEWTSGILSVVLVVLIYLNSRKSKTFMIPKSSLFVATILLPLAFLVSPLWAVDKGMTVMGFVKFLPLPLFMVLLRNYDKNDKDEEDLFRFLPLSGAIMTIMSFALGLIFPKEGYFLVSGRLAGFFQYPNTFALFLLVALALMLLRGGKLSKIDLICAPVLLIGIILSGSRTVFILLFLFIIYYVIIAKEKKYKIMAGISALLVCAGAGIYVLVTGNTDTVGRFLTTSLSSSTFVGRFLYFKDVLPQIIKHPLGLGYMGYFYSQPSFQTGVYTVNHVHNDLLQILIDIGWIPGLLFCYVFVRGFIKADMRRKAVLVIMALHLLFDFDMQFVCMDLILLMLLFDKKEEGIEIKNRMEFYVTAGAGVLLSLYFTIPMFLSFINRDDLAVKVYPPCTKSHLVLLTKAETVESMDKAADNVLKYNDSTAIAYAAKARVSFSKGDIVEMIDYQNKAIERDRYGLQEYLDYIDMLAVSTKLYWEAGDTESAKYCTDKIKEVPQRLEEVKNGTSSLAYKIKDKPELDLPQEYVDIINTLA
ncbi:MAG: O-antigen ligase family protein [Clostridiales bacterium]|nr:O-antigen ligase family protein [Clostridiales bacterium]